MCKHLVSCCEVPSVDFFDSVTRQTKPPFWSGIDHVLLEQYRNHAELADDDSPAAADGGVQSDDGTDDDGDEATAELSLAERVNDFKRSWTEAFNLFEEYESRGQEQFLEAFMFSNRNLPVLVNEVKEKKRQRTMPNTWKGRHKHPATRWA